MSASVAGTRKSRIQIFRFLVQILTLTVVVMGRNTLVRDLGLPRPLYIFSLVVGGMFFCGWACPFGTVQEWLRHVGKNVTGITIRIPPRIDKYLLFSRYVLLVFTGWFLLAMYDPRIAFSGFFAGKTGTTVAYAALGAVLLLSLVMDRPFCRYLCLNGALHGLMTMLRIFTIKRDGGTCVGCGKCDRACPMGVEVSIANTIRDPHCINCFSCVSSCSAKGSLAVGFALPSKEDVRCLKKKYNLKGDAHGAVPVHEI